MTVKNMWKPALGAMLVAGALPAQAQTLSSNLQISATVEKSCTVSAVNGITIAQLTTATADTASSNVSVTCTNGTPYEVLASLGANADGTQGQLVGDATNTFLHYNLYDALTGGAIWPSQVGTNPQTGSGDAQSYPISLRIVGSEIGHARADTYRDTVAFTVTY
jgi:spore coat protein U-like protein